MSSSSETETMPTNDPDQFLRVLTASVPVLLAYVDADQYYRFTNDAYAGWYGHAPAEVIGKHVREIIGEIAYEWVKPYLEVALSGLPVTFEQDIPFPDAENRYAHIALVPEIGTDGKVLGVSAALTDITDRRRAEEQNRRIQEELSLVIAGARCVLWYADVCLDLDNDPTDPDAMLRWDTQFADEDAMRGFGIPVLPGQNIAWAWHLSRMEEDRRRDDLNAVHHIRADEDYSQEFRIQRSDGSVIWMKEDVRVKTLAAGHWHLVGVTTDITDRKHAEIEREWLLQEAREAHARLQQSEGYLRLAVEGADVGIWQRDLRTEDRIWSAKSKILFGIPEDQEVTQEIFFQALHPDDRGRWREATDQALAGKAEYQIEFRVIWPDGSLHWLEAKGRAVQNEAGEFVRMEGVMLDISGRKRLEEELAATARGYKRIAETLQRALISAPQSRNSDNLSVQTLYQPAADQMLIGGDFYDLVVVDEDRVALVIGDLVGKGLTAAAGMAEVKFALRAFLTESAEPARTLERLNTFLFENSEEGLGTRLGLVSLVLAVINEKTGEAICAAAAAEPPLIVRESGETEDVPAGGLPLGVDMDADYAEAHVFLHSGDLLVLSTDGLSEARRGLTFFGREGVVRAARNALPLGATDTIAQAILEEGRTFAGGRFQDDVCLLVARRL